MGFGRSFARCENMPTMGIVRNPLGRLWRWRDDSYFALWRYVTTIACENPSRPFRPPTYSGLRFILETTLPQCSSTVASTDDVIHPIGAMRIVLIIPFLSFRKVTHDELTRGYYRNALIAGFP